MQSLSKRHNGLLKRCSTTATREEYTMRWMHKEKKTYAVLRKAGSKELFIAARIWTPSEDMCLYHSSITDNKVEGCVRPRPEWVLTDCQMSAELEAKSTLQTAQRIHSILSNSDNLEDTLPLTNSKRQTVTVSKFASATMSEDEVKKILKKTVKAYFHDIRDRIGKRESRLQLTIRRVSRGSLL
ncbi:unnamed protein product [Trichobilharzia regenti]|nr:unnamed protein product [Trichobilharzia regenti]